MGLFGWPGSPLDHSANLRRVDSIHEPLFNQDHWVIKRTASLITSGQLREGDVFSVLFSSATQHTGSWESSATAPCTLRDDGQAVIV